MSIIKFIISKAFLKQIAIAVVAIVVLCFVILKWLNVSTNHGSFETVPDLKGKSIDVARIELTDNKLVMEIQDSANYNPNYPKYSVIEQDPIAGKQVKEKRKIYITLNPSGYRKVQVPYLVGRTYRQVKPNLESLGFKIGKKTYVDYLGKDEVVKMLYKKEPIKRGDKLPKTAVIDIVLGNGNSSK